MEPDKIIKNICRLPEDFKQSPTSSITLIQQSGYSENPKALSHESVLGYLRSHPFLLDSWLMWSEDKRTSGGWYFKKDGSRFVVDRLGGHHGNPEESQKMTFTDAAEACAEFIIKEIKSISGL
ncbi:MAG TPA: hypothetical protein VLY45_07020 [Nitrospiria bacterium]|nr:hypothetical protein [Nitrospiria bacterium]